MYFGDIGRSGFAVGCLPAPLRSGLRQTAAEDFPSAPLTLAGQCRYRLCTRAPLVVFLRCRSAGHSPKAVVTGLKATFLKASRKSPDAASRAFQADTPLRYVTAFKSTIEEREKKNKG